LSTNYLQRLNECEVVICAKIPVRIEIEPHLIRHIKEETQ